MALKGNLRDFSITQLLNLVNLAHKTGLLNLEAPGDTAQVSFREGKLAYARVGAEDNSLAAILHRAHKISNAQHKLLKDRAANCLLYTSPSPRDRTRSRMPSSA